MIQMVQTQIRRFKFKLNNFKEGNSNSQKKYEYAKQYQMNQSKQQKQSQIPQLKQYLNIIAHSNVLRASLISSFFITHCHNHKYVRSFQLHPILLMNH